MAWHYTLLYEIYDCEIHSSLLDIFASHDIILMIFPSVVCRSLVSTTRMFLLELSCNRPSVKYLTICLRNADRIKVYESLIYAILVITFYLFRCKDKHGQNGP